MFMTCKLFILWTQTSERNLCWSYASTNVLQLASNTIKSTIIMSGKRYLIFNSHTIIEASSFGIYDCFHSHGHFFSLYLFVTKRIFRGWQIIMTIFSKTIFCHQKKLLPPAFSIRLKYIITLIVIWLSYDITIFIWHSQYMIMIYNDF